MNAEVKVPVQVDGRTLTLTNLGKVLYPDSGFTKAEVLDYYQRVAPALLPHIAGRPLTLKRYPEGVDGEAFFQKHVTAHRPDWIRTATVESDSSRARGARVTYLVVDDLPPVLEADGLAPLAKTSGGKGLQLYAAISGLTSEQASDQAKNYAERLE